MKRYISLLLILISITTVIVGLRSEVRWAGSASWGIAFILLLFALYFTKYISADKKQNGNK